MGGWTGFFRAGSRAASLKSERIGVEASTEREPGLVTRLL